MQRQQPNSTKITALYERLSRDDEQKNESISIAHQKQILENYAQRHGFTNIRHFSEIITSCLIQFDFDCTTCKSIESKGFRTVLNNLAVLFFAFPYS